MSEPLDIPNGRLISARSATRRERRHYEETETTSHGRGSAQRRRGAARIRLQPGATQQIRSSLCEGQHRR